MADERMQFTWDPIALAAQLRNIARQSQVLMRHFVSHQPDAIKFGMGHRSTLGFEFFELMTRIMTAPAGFPGAQIDPFYTPPSICQKTPRPRPILRPRHPHAPQ